MLVDHPVEDLLVPSPVTLNHTLLPVGLSGLAAKFGSGEACKPGKSFLKSRLKVSRNDPRSLGAPNPRAHKSTKPFSNASVESLQDGNEVVGGRMISDRQ